MGELASLPGGWIVQGGAVSLLGVVAWMVFTGRLIPRFLYKQIEEDRDHWRTAALKAMGQSDELMSGAQIASQVTRALSDATSTAVAQALAGHPKHPDRKS